VHTGAVGRRRVGRRVRRRRRGVRAVVSGEASAEGGGGFRRFLLLDEPTLQGVADLTGGSYYQAENADQLFEAFPGLPCQITLQNQDIERSFAFSAAGARFALVAFGLSSWWNLLS
jgi:hypothetical protein